MNAQSPKSISGMIHHSIVVAKIFLPVATKTVVQTSERKERPPNGERPLTNANRVNNEKKKDRPLQRQESSFSQRDGVLLQRESMLQVW